MSFKNTLQRGSVRYIVFKEDAMWYAVGLEFNIVESGDDPREALLSLFEAMSGYVKTASKIKARPHALNQKADKEYEKLWGRLVADKKSPTRTKMPPVFAFGERQLAVA